jgi:hypothetical protein
LGSTQLVIKGDSCQKEPIRTRMGAAARLYWQQQKVLVFS